jgi:DNA-binding GntR family transcriptional regulator
MDSKKTLIEEAYQKIKEMIFEHRLIPGQKLNYNQLGKACDMSPTPIINALYRLEYEGFVVSVPFKGFYVKKIGLQEAWDLFGAREALETYMVEQVILLAEAEDMAAIEERFAAHAAYQPAVYDRQRFRLDSDFHLQLATTSKNRVLTRQLAMIFEHFYIRFKFDTMSLERLQSSVDEHRQILDRIKRKDITGSRDAMHNHIHNARNHIIRTMDIEESDGSMASM